MKKQVFLVTFVTICWASFGLAQMVPKNIPPIKPFEEANIRFEQNATDGDVEVVFEIKGGDDGLTELTVISPDNRTIINFEAPDNSTMGIRQFRFESPEPKDVDALKAAYPAGVYKFSGVTENGQKFYSEAKLNHMLPPTVSFLQPEEEQEGVKFHNLEITWSQVSNIVAYILELEQDELGVNILVRLPSFQNSFKVPDEFLKAGAEYTLSIGTVAEDDNRSFVETTFITAGSE